MYLFVYFILFISLLLFFSHFHALTFDVPDKMFQQMALTGSSNVFEDTINASAIG